MFIDPDNEELLRLIAHINAKREENKRSVIDKLREVGYDIDYDRVRKEAKGTFGRPHIAKYLVRAYPQEFSSVRDVFDKVIGQGKKAFIETRDRVSINDAIPIIHKAGGLAILAHPGIYPLEHARKLIDFFSKNGGDGIETYYPYHIICPDY